MGKETSEDTPGGPASRADRLRNLWVSLAQRWPRRLRPRLPRLRPWQWAITAVLALLLVLWLSMTAQETSMYSATVLVTESSHGIAPPGNPFDFGDLPPTASIEHKITLNNDGKLDTYVMIIVSGEIRDFLDIEDAFFNLDPGQEREILVKLSVPATAEPGKRYDGRVVVTYLPWWSPS